MVRQRTRSTTSALRPLPLPFLSSRLSIFLPLSSLLSLSANWLTPTRSCKLWRVAYARALCPVVLTLYLSRSWCATLSPSVFFPLFLSFRCLGPSGPSRPSLPPVLLHSRLLTRPCPTSPLWSRPCHRPLRLLSLLARRFLRPAPVFTPPAPSPTLPPWTPFPRLPRPLLSSFLRPGLPLAPPRSQGPTSRGLTVCL